tara:strand:+ start:3360 stop:3542 length:183 start_codon:yes stop_codon:yes gene_type:complete
MKTENVFMSPKLPRTLIFTEIKMRVFFLEKSVRGYFCGRNLDSSGKKHYWKYQASEIANH